MVNKPLHRVGSFLIRRFRPDPYPVRIFPKSKIIRGKVLFSYIPDVLKLNKNSSYFEGHSNKWESREIGRILSEMGFIVDGIDWSDQMFLPKENYDVIFDICYNLGRFSDYLASPGNSEKVVKILHCTGSDPFYQNNMEQKRIRDLIQRRNCQYEPKRFIVNPEGERYSLKVADACSLIGNSHTLSTYPEEFRHKMSTVTVSASRLKKQQIKKPEQFIPDARQFLWFFGSGAVHKGLDLLLEVFASHPQYDLNIVGDVLSEEDFVKCYQKELLETPNVHYFGYLLPNSSKFKRIVANSFCFIAPTCSEAISTASATCLQIGLYPIISQDTGITLPSGCGIYLENSSIDEIRRAIQSTYEAKNDIIRAQISETQAYAIKNFSRTAFREQMQKFLTDILL